MVGMAPPGRPLPGSRDAGSEAAPIAPQPGGARPAHSAEPLARTMLGVPTPAPPRTEVPTSAAPEPPPAHRSLAATIVAATPDVAISHAPTDPPPPPESSTSPSARAQPEPRGAAGVVTRPIGTPTRLLPGATVHRGPSPLSEARPIYIPHALHKGPDAAERTVRNRTFGIAALAILGAALLGLLLVKLLPESTKLAVTGFSVDLAGNDRIEVQCSHCGAGTTLTLGAETVTPLGGVATLTPPAPLEVGKNELEVLVKKPDGAESRIEIVVPVAFRVRTDLSGHNHATPYAQIIVSAPNDAKVSVNGSETPVDAGVARYRIDYSNEATGENPRSIPITSDYAVVVEGPGLRKETSARVSSSIMALVLDSPANGHVLLGKPVAVRGRTLPFATVEVTSGGDAPTRVTADGKGVFGALVSHPSAGTVTVRALGGEQILARTARVELVSSAGAPPTETPYSSLVPGRMASVRGTVLESRTFAGTTTTLLDVTSGCGAERCLLNVTYGEVVLLRPGARLTVTGEVRPGAPLALLASRVR